MFDGTPSLQIIPAHAFSNCFYRGYCVPYGGFKEEAILGCLEMGCASESIFEFFRLSLFNRSSLIPLSTS